jgi:hypothetical protein
MKSKLKAVSFLTAVLLIFISFSFLQYNSSFAIINKTQKDSLPAVPYQPSIKRGWVGQYVYELNFTGKGNKPAPFMYNVSINRLHTGFVELSNEIRGAIRVNQPDKNNATRWESWIAEGKKPSWNYVNDTVNQVTVITSDKCCRTPHNHQFTVTTGSKEILTKGETHYVDLQIDRQTGTWILSVPKTIFKADMWDKWNVAGKKLNNYIREIEENTKGKDMKLQEVGDDLQGLKTWDTITGIIKPGQREIVIRRSIPLVYKHYLWHTDNGTEVFITPAVKGKMEFILTLKRVGE